MLVLVKRWLNSSTLVLSPRRLYAMNQRQKIRSDSDPTFSSRFREVWAEEHKNSYRGVILPVLLVGGFLIYYSNKTVEVATMKLELEKLKAQNIAPTGPTAAVIEGTNTSSEDDNIDTKEQRRLLRVAEKKLKDRLLANVPAMAVSLKVNEDALRREILTAVESKGPS